MNSETIKRLKQAAQSGREKALTALRDAIRHCPTCSKAQAITCTDCEARYKAALSS